MVVTKDSAEVTERLALNPRVRLHAQTVPNAVTKKAQKVWKRNEHQKGNERKNDFTNVKPSTLSEQGAIRESLRCLKCADAPCTKSCPTQIDIKSFISAIANKNYYGAAKMIFSDNPLGLSCGSVCPISELCAGGCNLNASDEGAININGLQEFACQVLKHMQVKQIRDPAMPKELPASFNAKVAIVGCGPAGISAASFLGRLGYTDVTVFEKNSFAGGLSATEIPQYRLGYDGVAWEVEMMQQLGVKIQYNKALGKDFTVESLKKDGFASVFVGTGMPFPKMDAVFEGLKEENGFFSSKTFLPKVSAASKPICECKETLPQLHGHVVVFGSGDTAFDCIGSAFRCGADKVTCMFRRGVPEIRAAEEEVNVARMEACDFVPWCSPKSVLTSDNGRIRGIEVFKTTKGADGKLVKDEDQFMRMKCDFVITAFGARKDDEMVQAMSPLTFNNSVADVDATTMQSAAPWVFAGGDLVGSAATVEAVNDGKVAAWSMHRYLQSLAGTTVAAEPKLPRFFTEVDEVDVSFEYAGIKFLNPYTLASAPPCTSAAMIRRAFEQGWAGCITKTYSLDKDLVTNVSPRIIRSTTHGHRLGPNQGGFMNIELISEKTAEYWITACQELKADFPNHVVVASIMCAYNREDWLQLASESLKSNADAMELNLSCPHGMGERGMGLACGQDPEMVYNICKWVREAVGADYPFFAKLTPNVTNIASIAAAAMKGGATGVTAINTVSGLMGLTPDAKAWPKVGKECKTTYGGVSGNSVRPLALKAISSIAKEVPNVKIMATGGVDSADATVQYIHCGSPIMQISSSIHNQEFTVIDDYLSGLRCHLYMQAREDLRAWNGPVGGASVLITLCPPAPKTQGEALGLDFKDLPDIGEHQAKRRRMIQEALIKADAVELSKAPLNPRAKMTKVPTVSDILGKGLPLITKYNQLNNKEQVVAEVDPLLCINCGKCYQTCADTGYQAISFDKDTHIPLVSDDCTGCALCFSVCPQPGALFMTDRVTPHAPRRGIAPGKY